MSFKVEGGIEKRDIWAGFDAVNNGMGSEQEDANQSSDTLAAIEDQSNAHTLPSKISYLEFLIFFLKSFDKLYLEQYDFGLPQSAISLRLTLDIFRVISEDK